MVWYGMVCLRAKAKTLNFLIRMKCNECNAFVETMENEESWNVYAAVSRQQRATTIRNTYTNA